MDAGEQKGKQEGTKRKISSFEGDFQSNSELRVGEKSMSSAYSFQTKLGQNSGGQQKFDLSALRTGNKLPLTSI